jgi:hypothetical protein
MLHTLADREPDRLSLPTGFRIAVVRSEAPRGNGHVVRRRFADIEVLLCRVLGNRVMLVQHGRPPQSFGLTGAVRFTATLGLGVPVVPQLLRSGVVPRLPTALLATGLVPGSSLSLVCRLVLDQVVRGRKRLASLAVAAIGSGT